MRKTFCVLVAGMALQPSLASSQAIVAVVVPPPRGCYAEVVDGPSINKTLIFRGCTERTYWLKLTEFKKAHPDIDLLALEAHGSFSALAPHRPPTLSYFKVVFRDRAVLTKR